MKKINLTSKIVFGFSLLLFAVANLAPLDSLGVEEAKKKQVEGCTCLVGNEIVGFGNKCITGEGACVANDCPSGSTASCGTN